MFQILHVCPKPRGELTGTEAILTASGTSAGVGLAIPVSQSNMTVESFGSRMKQMSHCSFYAAFGFVPGASDIVGFRLTR